MNQIAFGLVVGSLLMAQLPAFSICKSKHQGHTVPAPIGLPEDGQHVDPALLAAKDQYHFNLRISVPQAIVGVWGASLTYKFTDTFALGPVLKTLHWTKSLRGGFYGVEGAYAFSGHLFMPGWQMNPFIHYWHYKDSDDQAEGEFNRKSYVVGGSKFTYQWIMPNGFNVQAGFGLLVNRNKMPIGANSWAQKGFVLFPALTLGWAF